MWECPKCGRKFKNTNQNHYCGTAPQTIEEYIAQQPKYTRTYLLQISETIRSALPDAIQANVFFGCRKLDEIPLFPVSRHAP